MQRAGQKRPVSARVISATPSVPVLNIVSASEGPLADRPVDVELLPQVQLLSLARQTQPEPRDPRHVALEVAIRQRIESRLHGRVRNLHIRAEAGQVTLEGECTTFYTKQLAQHAAMGILEDEQLDNSIVVAMQ